MQIWENTETIGKLSKGNIDDLADLKNMFFTKSQDLVSTMIKERKKYMDVIRSYQDEIDLKAQVEKKQDQEMNTMREEILIAKKILKDPSLTEMVNKKFGKNIDTKNQNRMTINGAQVRDIIRINDEWKENNFDVGMLKW